MSVCTLPPGGVSPGASRWSAAPTDDSPAFPIRNAASTSAPTAAKSTVSPIVLLVANLDDSMILSLLPICEPCPVWGASCSPQEGGPVRRAIGSNRSPIRDERAGEMRRRRMLLGGTAAAVAAVVVLLGGIFSGSAPVDPLRAAAANATPSASDQDSLRRLLEGFSSGDTAGYVRMLERRVARRPRLPAAGPRDRRPRLLPPLRRDAQARDAGRRSPTTADRPGSGIARKHAPPLPRGAQACAPGDPARPRERLRLRRLGRRAAQPRSLPRGVQSLRPDGRARAGDRLLHAGGERARAARTAGGRGGGGRARARDRLDGA